MQGAFKILIAVVATAGALPAASTAQVLDVPPAQLPSVSVPPVPLPAPLPQVSTPPVSTPPVTVPGVRVDAPLPSAPPVPQVQAPAPAAPRPALPVVDSAPSTTPSRTSGGSSGQAPSGTVAAAGTPSASPARGGRVARAAAVPGGRGVLGTSYRSRRRLVRELRACVAGLPAREERLVVMRYGVGAAVPRPDRAVAGALGLSPVEYATLQGRALRGIVRDARDGGCHEGPSVGTAPAIAFGNGGELRSASTTVGAAAAAGAAIAVRGERASGGFRREDADRGGPHPTPLAVDVDAPGRSLLGELLLVVALAAGVLAAIGVRARVRR
jgi:hypothetical protein